MTDFDEVIDRRDTHSQKWDDLEKNYGVPADSGIPLWVADMDFRAPPPVNAALQRMVDHGVHGYYGDDTSFRAAMAGWMKRRHDWTIEPEWALQTHGLVNAIAMVIQACSAPGEGSSSFRRSITLSRGSSVPMTGGWSHHRFGSKTTGSIWISRRWRRP